MSAEKILIDTSVWIEYFRNRSSPIGDRVDRILDEDDNCPYYYNPDQGHVERGDIDCIDGIDVLDVFAVVNHILNTNPLYEAPYQRADCNADGEINVLDVIGIVNVILGRGSCEP